MKEKIEQFAIGEFEYELPTLNLSIEKIEISVEAGKQFEGSFTIANSNNRTIKGILYSSNPLLSFDSDVFKGKENLIMYRFDASYLKSSDILKGNITILSDCGEFLLPFTITVDAPTIHTSIGKIKNLFEFANLARMDWTEAKKVFRSDEFERVILKNDKRFHIIYHNLLKSISTSQALEEFLIAVNKKAKITIDIDKTQLEYDIQEDIMDKLVLTKDQWGYAEIRVSTNTPFILLEQKFLWSDRFIGNKHSISFVISAKDLRPGNNYGRIMIKTIHQTIVVDVVCRKHNKVSAELKPLDQRMKFKYDFTKSYLDFRIGRIKIERYIQEIKTWLTGIDKSQDRIIETLVNLHLAILSDNKRLASKLISELSDQEHVLSTGPAYYYCAYLYLQALFKKDEETTLYVTDIIKHYYLGGNYDPRILWFLLYTDKRYDRNISYKLKDIKDHFDGGCHSPVLYYEAICVYNKEPYLLRDLNDFEIQVMNFGIKNDCLTMELILQYTYLAGRLKNYQPIVFRGLKRLYELYKKDEILSVICSLLIKGFKRDNKYFEWYSLGVNAQLRITELYEYYMYSVNEDRMEPLPQSLLIYFIYNSRLNDKKRAYLYANIINNQKINEDIYQLYYKRMEVFTQKQLELKKISPNMAVLYKHFKYKPSMEKLYADYLPEVLFVHELECDNPNIVSVAIVHKELDEEEVISLTEGKAYIEVYTKDADIFLIDSYGNRYVSTVDYRLIPLLGPENFHEMSMNYEHHPKLLLYLLDHYQRNRVVSEASIELRRFAVSVSGLKESYYIECLLTLIEHYYENYNPDLLEEYLLKLDLAKVKESHRIKYLEYMVIRGYYEKALDAFKRFGIEGISINRLLKLCSGCISNGGIDKKEDILVYLCYYIFSHGKYNDAILSYLVNYYNGPCSDMLVLWQQAKDFDVDTHNLDERLLTQILFTESNNKGGFQVFFDYYSKVTNHLLVAAYITYYSYRYLVHNEEIDHRFFPIVRREQNYEENKIALLAWLKHNAGVSDLSENEKNFISYHIDKFERQGIIFSFFKKYKGLVKLSDRITDRSYVEYYSNPKKQVFLHYRLLNDNEEFITELMPNVLLGFHMKSFILFYNEELEYYVTEEWDQEINVSDRYRLKVEDMNSSKEDSKYKRINNMINKLDMQDEQGLLNMMADYIEREYIISKCYEPLP